mgnify:FL=1
MSHNFPNNFVVLVEVEVHQQHNILVDGTQQEPLLLVLVAFSQQVVQLLNQTGWFRIFLFLWLQIVCRQIALHRLPQVKRTSVEFVLRIDLL